MITHHLHHIIPKHLGGSDEPSNLIKLTVAEHSEAHRVLYKKHGLYKDKLAWLGLSKMIGKDQIIKELYKDPAYRLKLRNAKLGKKRSATVCKAISKGKCKYLYKITFPNGSSIISNNLWQFCKKHNLNHAAMWKTLKGQQSNHKQHLVEYQT